MKTLREYLTEVEMSNNKRLIDALKHKLVIEVQRLYDTVINESDSFDKPAGMLYNQNFIHETTVRLEEYYSTLNESFSENDLIIIAVKELLDYFNS